MKTERHQHKGKHDSTIDQAQPAMDPKSAVAVFKTHSTPQEVSRPGDFSEFVEQRGFPELMPREQRQLSFGSHRYWGINE
jgi:hypothetical protein